MLDKAVGIYEREGVRGFFKGNLISMVGIVPFIAIKQSLYDYQTNTLSSAFFTQQERKNSNYKYFAFNMVSGMTSGFVACSFCYPFDITRRLMQLNGV